LLQVRWFWGETPEQPPHQILDRDAIAREMMQIANRYDQTEEYNWTKSMRHTDRQGSAPGRKQLITAALGGKLPGRIELQPHSIVASWDDPDPNIARLVSYGDQKTVKANLYNFDLAPRTITMRLWRLQKGEYLLRVGRDQDNDGEIDAKEDILREEKVRLNRFSTITLTIPSQENVAVQLALTKSISQSNSLPDLALHPTRDLKEVGEKMIVKVHNIGNAPAENIAVEILDVNGKVLEKKLISRLEPPVDLIPKVTTLEFELNEKKWHSINIDRKGQLEEIYKGNNVILNPY
jgi:hypothetical protein